jgi:hypothetical protein
VSWPRRSDDLLVQVLRDRALPENAPIDARVLFEAAERHGVLGVVLDIWRGSGTPLPPVLELELDRRAAARELDHDAHLALLDRIDRRFEQARLRAVVLKGPLLAERLYARPYARATSDLDLLVIEADLDVACAALADLGFSLEEGPEGERFRREHHHVRLSHPDALPLELHFQGYVGFGRTLPSAPLLERSRAAAGLAWLRVLEPADELVFLAVHAAVHRFVRLGWLEDIRLLLEKMSPDEIEVASARARAWGFARVLRFTLALREELLGGGPPLAESEVASARERIARRLVGEPASPVLRSATRLVYTGALCDTPGAALRYAVRTSASRVRQRLRRGR